MANTFLAAQGYDMGKSLVEQRSAWPPQLRLMEQGGDIIQIPVDLRVATGFARRRRKHGGQRR